MLPSDVLDQLACELIGEARSQYPLKPLGGPIGDARRCQWPYGRLPASLWAPLASLVLEAAYEATLLAVRLNAARGASDRVLLTRLGGGAFGNDDAWIHHAMLHALRRASSDGLGIAIVSFGPPSQGLQDLMQNAG